MSDQSTSWTIETIHPVAEQFPLPGRLVDVCAHGSGHINDTLAVTYDQAGRQVRYIFQRINHRIFKDVPLLMDNIRRVTTHLAAKQKPGDDCRVTTLIDTVGGEAFHRTPSGDYWRVFLFVENARTYDEIQTPAQAFEAARAFGAFQCTLADLPGARLQETIPGFHDTRRRLETLRKAMQEDVAGRKGEVAAELDFVFRREAMVEHLPALVKTGALCERVTHNDTKINNVMLDDATGQGVCVIDLDTVMPGLSLYDFGDMVRTAVSPAAEDERDLSKVAVRMPVFEALARGFAEGAGTMLTPAEWDNLVFSGRIITLETGIRFLTDYLQGDVYFKTKRPGHNLDRCRAQFRLVECLEAEAEVMQKIVDSLQAEHAGATVS